MTYKLVPPASPPIVAQSYIEACISNGQAYGVLYTQTIGGSAQGQYGLSIFNPANSGKTIRVFSIQTMENYSNTTTWIYLNTADPAYNQNLSTAIVNLQGGGPASVLGSHVTANSASVSFPGSGNASMALGSPEVISNKGVYVLPPGNGLAAQIFVANSQEYALAAKWLEL